ncbi:MAG: HAD family hydrolase [Candidatus Hodarchaeales archaeon]
MIKGIVFDIDGTLLQHDLAVKISLKHLYSFVKNKISYSSFKEFLTLWKVKSNQYMNEYLNGKISFEEQRTLRVQSVLGSWDYNLSSNEAMEAFKIYLVKYEQNWMLYNDVLPCLNIVKNFPLGVISVGEGEQQRSKLTFTKIEPFFDSIIISGEVGLRKPLPEIFQRSAKELNLSLNEILYVGDHLEIDALGALNAGMYGVWINRTEQIHKKSDIRMISKLTDLPHVIEHLQK